VKKGLDQNQNLWVKRGRKWIFEEWQGKSVWVRTPFFTPDFLPALSLIYFQVDLLSKGAGKKSGVKNRPK